MPIESIPVNAGFSWTAAGAWSTFVALLFAIVRQVGPWQKQRDTAEADLRNALVKRVERLEQTLDYERVKHEAERALDRHKIRNLVQCLDAVLLVLETAPEKTVEVVSKVRAMRDEQMKAEAAEAAAIRAAELRNARTGSTE